MREFWTALKIMLLLFIMGMAVAAGVPSHWGWAVFLGLALVMFWGDKLVALVERAADWVADRFEKDR